MRQNSSLVVFQQAMHQFLVGGDFLRLSQRVVQFEVLNIIGNSIHYSLADSLRKVLEDSRKEDMEIEDSLEDAIEDVISQLEMVKKVHKRNPNAFKPQRGMISEEAQRAKTGAIVAGRGPNSSYSNRLKFTG